MSKNSKKIKKLSLEEYENYLDALLLGEKADIPDVNKD